MADRQGIFPASRRQFITLLGSAAAWPLAGRAQQARKVWRIGFLAGGTRPVQLESSVYAGFLRGMREFGYVERQDFVMEWRFAEGRNHGRSAAAMRSLIESEHGRRWATSLSRTNGER